MALLLLKKIIVKSLFETLLYLQPQSNPNNKKGNYLWMIIVVVPIELQLMS
jgi:hypothetical protein